MGTAEGLGGKGVLWVIVCTLELAGPRPSTGPSSLTSRVVCTGLGAPALTLVNLPNQQSHAALSPWDN